MRHRINCRYLTVEDFHILSEEKGYLTFELWDCTNSFDWFEFEIDWLKVEINFKDRVVEGEFSISYIDINGLPEELIKVRI